MNGIKSTKSTADSSAMFARLETVQMSEWDRLRAMESLRAAEGVLDFFSEASARVRAILHGTKHTVAGLGGDSKTALARPAKH